MDPLSVAASIIGILAAAVKVAEILGPLVSTLKDTAKCAARIYAEVNSTRIILSALQALFEDLNSAPRRRRGLIQVSQLIATLTDGVLLFGELEPLVLQLGTTTEKWTTRIQWALKKDLMNSFIARVQLFKGSIGVMLNILQCDSDLEAASNHTQLCDLTLRLLNSNKEISNRLALLERHPSVDDVNNYHTTNGRISTNTLGSQIRSFGFEGDLEGSWVYRKARRSTTDVSFKSSIALSHAWSALTDISLSDISIISVVALPISANELFNGIYYLPSGPQYSSGVREQGFQQDMDQFDNKTQTLTQPRTKLPNMLGIIPAPATLNGRVTKTMRLTDAELEHGTYTIPWPGNQFQPNQPISGHSGVSVLPLHPALTEFEQAGQERCASRGYRIVVVGVADLGQFDVAKQFLQYQYPVEDRLRKTLQTPYIIDNECALIHIDVIDPKWEGEHLPILERTLRAGHGFMLVYSVESRVSLLSLWTLQQEIFRVTEKDKLPMVLVGVHRKNRRRREVTLQEGTDVAGLIGCPFYEVSHETEHNLENAYYDIVREIRADDKRQSAADGHREAAQWARVNKLRQLQIVDVDAFTG